MDLFNVKLTEAEVGRMSVLGLAHVGDAVYELLVRSSLCRGGLETAKNLHRETVKFVSAPAQAAAAKKIHPLLSEDERSVFRRGRNTRVNSVPSRSTIEEYHAATALETLFGWLYLRGETERLSELFSAVTEENGDAT